MNKKDLKRKLFNLKEKSGTHSPSFQEIKSLIGQEVEIIDSCFLTNPYATELFCKNLKKDLIDSGEMFERIYLYQPQTKLSSEIVANRFGLEAKNTIVGNGAIEIIQSVLQFFVRGKLLVMLPTFSSYYEYVSDETEVVFSNIIQVSEIISKVKKEKINNVVVINPNNPTGNLYVKDEMIKLCEGLRHIDNLIVDESFIHYSDKRGQKINSCENLIEEFENLVIIKSMAKDYGLAGVRCGYGVMNETKVEKLYQSGYLWNTNVLSSYFYEQLKSDEFCKEYEKCRLKYLSDFEEFVDKLSSISDITVLPSSANFVLIDLGEIDSFDFTNTLLADTGVYVRSCHDKLGIGGNFIRVAGLDRERNEKIFQSIKLTMEKYK